jgi:mono/diheme cytochrome c family protein
MEGVRILICALGLTIFALEEAACDPVQIGQALYLEHCAVCHGVSGDATQATPLGARTHASDLTLLSRQNGGQFPDSYVSAIIVGQGRQGSHTPSDMPLWGLLFEEELDPLTGRGFNSDLLLSFQVAALVDYVRHLQKE